MELTLPSYITLLEFVPIFNILLTYQTATNHTSLLAMNYSNNISMQIQCHSRNHLSEFRREIDQWTNNKQAHGCTVQVG